MRQSNNPEEAQPKGYEAVAMDAEAAGTLRGLYKAPAAPPSMGSTLIHQASSRTASGGGWGAAGGARFIGGVDHEGDPLYVLGGPALNRFGGLTTWADNASGTAGRVELWVRGTSPAPAKLSLCALAACSSGSGSPVLTC